MAHLATGSVGRQIESLFDGSSVAGLTDRQLVERFTVQRDAAAEVAFTALVARHGPMVLGICRQVLADQHHAEDAFQAVFLVLACKARSIRNTDLLGTWLYGVALRTAQKAKTRLGRQRRNGEDDVVCVPGAVKIVEPMVSSADVSAMAREQAVILHDEIARLPWPFRLPVLLCYFEGLTLDEAAQRLQWPPGTLRSRLARARDKLRRSLTRRGVALPAAALAAVLDARPVSAAISSNLCDLTARAAMNFAAGQSEVPLAAKLAQEVLKSMFVTNLKLVALAFLFIGAVATGAGFVAKATGRQTDKLELREIAAPPDEVNSKPLPGRMFIGGRVLDPRGKPMPNATVMAYKRRSFAYQVIGHSQSNASGTYHLDVPRTSSARDEGAGAVALAPGYGIGWVEIDPDADQPRADISLRPEQVIHGRLFDLKGKPAASVTVSVSAVCHVLQRNPVRRRERVEGPTFRLSDEKDRPGWPGSTVTDAEGRFTIHGIGRNLRASLKVHDARFALQDIDVETDNNGGPKQVSVALEPAQTITGRVTYRDTGKPISCAPVHVKADKSGGESSYWVSLQTDDKGWFRANPYPGDHFVVSAGPPNGQPYLSNLKVFDWPKGAIEYSIDLSLPRGVAIRGRVTEQGSGKPVARASVQFNSPSGVEANSSNTHTAGQTDEDGRYQLTAVPGPAHLAIDGPSMDYVSQAVSHRLFFGGQPGGRRAYFHAFAACNPTRGGPDLEVNFTLRRGVTVHGQVIGPDGQEVPDAWLISRVVLARGGQMLWRGDFHGTAHSGRFEIHGLDPDAEVPVHFLEPNRKLGATALFTGKAASGGPVTVRLEPCVKATARLVDAVGKPVVGFSAPWLIWMVVTPGPIGIVEARKEGDLFADAAPLLQVDPINHGHNPVTDTQGRITFPALIPGATYRIIDRTSLRHLDGPQHRKEFTVKAGEVLELGDILIEKPQVGN